MLQLLKTSGLNSFKYKAREEQFDNFVHDVEMRLTQHVKRAFK